MCLVSYVELINELCKNSTHTTLSTHFIHSSIHGHYQTPFQTPLWQRKHTRFRPPPRDRCSHYIFSPNRPLLRLIHTKKNLGIPCRIAHNHSRQTQKLTYSQTHTLTLGKLPHNLMHNIEPLDEHGGRLGTAKRLCEVR